MKMKTQAVVGLLAAGMMAVTGFAGVQSILGGTITAVEKTMEENGRSSALSYSGEKGITGKVTEYKSLDDVVKNLEKGDGYKFVKIAGYGEKALVVAPRDDDPNDDHAGIAVRDGVAYGTYVVIYSKRADGKIVTAGALKTGSSGQVFHMDPKTGVIYTHSHHTYETYFLSADGGELLHKDFFQDDDSDVNGTCWGYKRDVNTKDPVECDITLAEYNKLRKDADKVSVDVVFDVK